MFETLGWSDRDWSRKLGIASIALMFEVVGSLIAARVSAVVESAFTPKYDDPRLEALRARGGFKVFQIYCTADFDSLVSRIEERVASGATSGACRRSAGA